VRYPPFTHLTICCDIRCRRGLLVHRLPGTWAHGPVACQVPLQLPSALFTPSIFLSLSGTRGGMSRAGPGWNLLGSACADQAGRKSCASGPTSKMCGCTPGLGAPVPCAVARLVRGGAPM
jgi:hypothetical protein